MTNEDFVREIENTYGNYKNGMRKVILEKLKYAGSQGLQKLYLEISENYESMRPPSLSRIFAVIYQNDVNVQIGRKYYFISVCEFCGEEYSLEYYICPGCKKPRIFGGVKRRNDNHIPFPSLPRPKEKVIDAKISELFGRLVEILRSGKIQEAK